MRNKVHIKLFMMGLMSICLVLPVFLSPIFNKNYQLIIHPIIWILLAITTFFILPKYHYKYDLNRYDVRQFALIGALLYIIIYFSSGLIIGYTSSPYDHSVLGITKNLWMFLTVIIAQEFVRNAFFKTTTKQDKWFTIISVTIFFILLDLNIFMVGNIFENVSTFMGFLTKDLIAIVVMNAFISYLTYRDGIKAALLFKLPYSIVFLLTPVFPANIFAALLVMETVIPLLIYLKIEKEYKKNNVFGLQNRQTFKDKIAHYIFAGSLISLIAFSMGLLPYAPMVIASNSMFPLIERGDIVVTKKIAFNNIKINDIIEYKLDNIYVVHRVISITETNEGRKLITKGDNNNSNDKKPVFEDQVHGIIVGNIPKVGYPTLWLKDIINNTASPSEIETGGN